MAQAMILTSNFCGHATTPLKNKHPSLYSHLVLPPRFSSPSSSSTLPTFALLKSKTKAAPEKQVLEKPKRRVEDGIFGGFTKQNGFAISRDSIGSILTAQSLVSAVLAFSLVFCSGASGQEGGGALFNRACIGCHVGGGNVIQPGATLFADDLERNGVATEDEIYGITYSGKGRMPGFGEKCTPRGQCTFGPRLMDEEIRLLAQFVKLQAQQGWPKVE